MTIKILAKPFMAICETHRLCAAVIVTCALITGCSVDPTDVKWGTTQPAWNRYYSSSLQQIVQDSLGKLWAASSSYLFRIDPVGGDALPGNAGILKYCGGPYMNFPRLFIDKTGLLLAHNYGSLYRMNFDSNDSIISATNVDASNSGYAAYDAVSQDENGNILYITRPGRAYEVRKWDGTAATSVVADSLPDDTNFYTYRYVLAANAEQIVVGTAKSDDTMDLIFYRNNTRTQTQRVGITRGTGNKIVSIFLMDKQLYLTIVVFQGARFPCVKGMEINCDSGTQFFQNSTVIARLDSAGPTVISGQYLFVHPADFYAPYIVKSRPHRTILYNNVALYTITPDSVAVTLLRSDYSPVPFTDNKGNLMFYYQEARRFIDSQGARAF
jgi:hypothetical protein